MARQLSNGPFFITTAPSVTTCGTCQRILLAATVDGFDHRIDMAALNDQGELAALLERRATYELHGELLVRRTALHITADRDIYPVLADHTCAVVPDDHLDHVRMEVAVLLAMTLLGATPVLPDNPDF